MRILAAVLYSIAALAAAPGLGLGQSEEVEKDYAAWAAMMLTPIGAFTPVMVSPGTKRGERVPAFVIRGGAWALEGGKSNLTFGGTLVAPLAAKAALSLTAVYYRPGCPSDVNCHDTVMAGGEYESPFFERSAGQVTATVMSASFRGSVGHGRFLGPGGGNTSSVVASIPLAVRRQLASRSSVSAFLSPGYGLGFVSAEGEPHQNGQRHLLGGGVAWTSASGIGIHVGAQKVFFEPSAILWGLAMSFVPNEDIRRRHTASPFASFPAR